MMGNNQFVFLINSVCERDRRLGSCQRLSWSHAGDSSLQIVIDNDSIIDTDYGSDWFSGWAMKEYRWICLHPPCFYSECLNIGEPKWCVTGLKKQTTEKNSQLLLNRANPNDKFSFHHPALCDSISYSHWLIVKHMHSGNDTGLHNDYISSETEPCLQKILHDAVTFRFWPVESWWSLTSVTSHMQRLGSLCLLDSHYIRRSSGCELSQGSYSNAKISVFFLFNVVTAAYSRWHVSPKTNSLPFPPCQPSELTASWQAVLWAA